MSWARELLRGQRGLPVLRLPSAADATRCPYSRAYRPVNRLDDGTLHQW